MVKKTPAKSIRKRKAAPVTTETEAESVDEQDKRVVKKAKIENNRLQLFAEYSFLITKSKILTPLLDSQCFGEIS